MNKSQLQQTTNFVISLKGLTLQQNLHLWSQILSWDYELILMVSWLSPYIGYHLDMTIAVDWDLKNQTKQTYLGHLRSEIRSLGQIVKQLGLNSWGHILELNVPDFLSECLSWWFLS